MVSFDVKSLFTNVPLQETIDLISNKIYDKNSNANRLPIKKKIFKKLLNLATKGIFLYKDKLQYISKLMVFRWVHHLVLL